MPVVVVTDSSSRLQPEELKRCGIRQVPLHVLLDGRDLRDGVDDVPTDVSPAPRVTTAGATPAELAEIYRQALSDSDGDGVVAVHISAALSSTYSAAVQAAREFGPAVRVVNSRSAAMGVGFVALAAARAGRPPVRTWMPLRPRRVRRVPRGHAFIVVHRLDNLRRSGRIRTGRVAGGLRAVAEAAVVSRRRRPAGAGPTDPHRHQGACGDGRSGRRGRRRASARRSRCTTSTITTPPTTSPRR